MLSCKKKKKRLNLKSLENQRRLNSTEKYIWCGDTTVGMVYKITYGQKPGGIFVMD